MSHIYEEIKAELEAGRTCVLATVVMRKGSAPRSLGTKMLLKDDGSLVGSVGGGPLEAQTIKAATELLSGGVSRVLDYDLMDKEAEACGMICGGYVNVYIERMAPGDSELPDMITTLCRISSTGEYAALGLAPGDDRPWGRRFVITRERLLSWPEAEWPKELEILKEQFQENAAIRPRWLGNYFVEPVEASPTVYVFGGGHISQQIAPMAALVDFRVKVIDDRMEFASPQRFPAAEEVICRPFEGAVESLHIGPSGYVVIVTRGHSWDGLVLADVLKTDAAYIGMIGSRHKRNAIYQSLLQTGFTKEDIDRVHSPIGLDIKAETPEEIALSIVAELVAVRGAKSKGIKNWKV